MKNLRKTEIQRIKKKASENIFPTLTFFILLLLTLLPVNRIYEKYEKVRSQRSSGGSYVVKEVKIVQIPYFVKTHPPDFGIITKDSLSTVEKAILEYIQHQYSKLIIDDSFDLSYSQIILKHEDKFLTLSKDSVWKLSDIKRGINNILAEFQLDYVEKQQILQRFSNFIKANLVIAGVKRDTSVTTKFIGGQEMSINALHKRLLLNTYFILIFLMAFIFTSKELKKRRDPRQTWVLLLSYILLVFYPAVLPDTVYTTSIYFFPLPLMLSAFFTGFKFPFYMSLSFTALMLPAVEGNILQILLLNIPIAVISILYGERIKKPWNYLEAFIVVTFTALSLKMLLTPESMRKIYQNTITIILICGVSILSFVMIHPTLEKILRFPSIFTSIDLTNMNHPLLLQLQNQAPGTFEHSIRVAELGARVAGCIGINPLLARACGLYHDIGKMLHPIFFIENQVSGENPHNRISPEMSVLILKGHVIDGINLAKKYRLPDEIVRVIATHHGTSLMLSIYKKAISLNGSLDKDKFRYSGPKPRSKLEGIFMIVDGVEAASRALDERTEEKFRQLVDEIVEEKIADGQFSECELTYAEIEKIKNELIRALLSHYHLRIKYHEDKGY